VRRPLLIFARFVVLLYAGLCAALLFFQRSLIYFPQPAAAGDSATTVALPGVTNRVLVSVREKDVPRAIVYFGGNAEDVSLDLPSFSAWFSDAAVYLLHYRGYGGSSGQPSQETLFSDGLALFDAVHAKHSNVEVIGRSLGSGIAVYVASSRPVSRLVLVTPFDSLEEIAALRFPWAPVRWILQDKYESWKYAPRVSAPTVILAADQDEIFPHANTELLASHFKTSVVTSFRTLAGTGHNTISAHPEYMQILNGSL
jgi:pimeloyl-ACP methyl ester carboxylesterase